jgi:hypothetical protein
MACSYVLGRAFSRDMMYVMVLDLELVLEQGL